PQTPGPVGRWSGHQWCRSTGSASEVGIPKSLGLKSIQITIFTDSRLSRSPKSVVDSYTSHRSARSVEPPGFSTFSHKSIITRNLCRQFHQANYDTWVQ